MQEFPRELQQSVAEFLTAQQLLTLSKASKSWHTASEETLAKRVEQLQQAMAKRHTDMGPLDLRLFAAAYLGLLRHVNEALMQGANINAQIYFDRENNISITPLHFAARSGNLACVKRLIDLGLAYRPGQPQESYLSPLHYAAATGKVNCVAYFLDHGVPVDQESTISCPLGWNWTPLQMAASQGHNDCVTLLLERGANVNAKDPDQYQAIHRASAHGHADCLQTLLTHGANPNAVNEDNVTPLLMATNQDHTACIELLLQAKAKASTTSFIYQCYTPLHLAIKKNDLATAEALLKYDPKVVDAHVDSFPTALHLACRQGNVEAVELLLKYKADVNIPDAQGEKPIDIASAFHHEAIVKRLEPLSSPAFSQAAMHPQ